MSDFDSVVHASARATIKAEPSEAAAWLPVQSDTVVMLDVDAIYIDANPTCVMC